MINPPSLKIQLVSRTIGVNRVVNELVPLNAVDFTWCASGGRERGYSAC